MKEKRERNKQTTMPIHMVIECTFLTIVKHSYAFYIIPFFCLNFYDTCISNHANSDAKKTEPILLFSILFSLDRIHL